MATTSIGIGDVVVTPSGAKEVVQCVEAIDRGETRSAALIVYTDKGPRDGYNYYSLRKVETGG